MTSETVERGPADYSPSRTQSPRIQAFFDEATNSVSYLVSDPASGTAAIIDPVLAFDPVSGRVDGEAAEQILNQARRIDFDRLNAI